MLMKCTQPGLDRPTAAAVLFSLVAAVGRCSMCNHAATAAAAPAGGRGGDDVNGGSVHRRQSAWPEMTY